jgi:Rrf2 family protein
VVFPRKEDRVAAAAVGPLRLGGPGLPRGPPAGATVPSHVIARDRGVPERYLLKILKPLAAGGLLRSVKGPNGGYRLTRPAAEVTLLDVVRLVEPALAEPGASHGARLDPVLAEVMAEAAESFREVLARWTLADCLAAEGRPPTKRGK